MSTNRKTFSVCIPAYNRSRYLRQLLDSILLQEFKDFEIVICEDESPERRQIAAIVLEYEAQYPGFIRYYENETNLGYDANIRCLIEKSTARYCFFMGNDDLMAEGALSHLNAVIKRHPRVGVVLRGYRVFDGNPHNITHELRYYSEEREFNPGKESIVLCYRRSGVISGYIVHRDDAFACATDQFDGTLYYQMHVTASVLSSRTSVCTPEILVLCRANEPPDFGNSKKEKGIYTPGRYTIQARLNMVRGALSILADREDARTNGILEAVKHDYANYFYPFVLDQLTLPVREYIKLYRGYWKMGFGKYFLFHVYSVGCYILGSRRFDGLTRIVRKYLGRNVQFATVPR
jgi:glycosyltransferase involved in cell wall biosynthesis